MPQTSVFFLATVALIGASACSKPVPPTITPKSAQVLAVSQNGVQLAVNLDVSNPNHFPLMARAVDGRLLLGAGEGTELGRAHAEPATGIPAESTATVTTELAVAWTNLAALAPFMLSPAAVAYRFVGTAKIGGESVNLSLPFTLSGELTRAQLINAGLNGLVLPGLK